MQTWKKVILKKNRLSSHQETNHQQSTRQNKLYEYIDKMQNHFCRLLSFYIRLKHTQTYLTDILDFSVLEDIIIQTPENLNLKEEKKLLHTLYRRIRLVLQNFQDEEYFVRYMDQVFNQQRQGSQDFLRKFFKLSCSAVVRQIYAIKKHKQKERQRKSIQITKNMNLIQQISNFKLTHKKNSEILCETIYSQLDLEQIEACFLLLEEANLVDNINYVYGKIKGRNKKIVKQINTHEKKIALKKYFDLKSYWTEQNYKNKVSPSRNTTKKLSISKRQVVKVQFKSLSKSLSKKRISEKSKLKLDPIILKKDKIKLKLLR